MDRLVATYTEWIRKFRYLVVAVSLLAIVSLGTGLPGLSFTSDYRVYFGERNPQRETYERFEQTYAQTDNILIVVAVHEGTVFDRDTIAVVRDLTERAWEIPHAIRVDSISNFQHLYADGDDLIVEDLVPEGTLSERDIARIRDIALTTPELAGALVDRDGRAAGINVTLQFPGDEHHQHLIQSVEAARELVNQASATASGVDIVMTGIAPLGYAEYAVSERETRTLFPWVMVLLLAISWLVLKSLSGTLMVTAIIVGSTVMTMGAFGWAGFDINTSSAAAPVIIMTLAVADSIHVLLSAAQAVGEGKPKDEAIVESMTLNREPVFLTSLTTTLGFLSLNFSDVPPFQDVGNIAASGVVFAWILSMTLLPAMMYILPMTESRVARHDSSLLAGVGEFVIRHRRPVVFIMLLLPALSMISLPTITLDDRFIQWFDRKEPIRQDTDFASEHLVGPFRLEVSVPSGEANGIYKPAYLEHLAAFEAWLARQPHVEHVSSIVPLLKRINRSMHGGDEAYYRLPEDRELVAQYILLYELSLPYGRDLTTTISLDKASSRVTIILDAVTAEDIRQISARITGWFADNTPLEMHTTPTGTAVIFATLAKRNIIAMLWGTGIAFALIAVILVVALRSPLLGALSLIPNGLPVLITFGLWAVFVGEIGIIASIIAATSMGLIVDDTVHILSKYHRARVTHKQSPEDAVRYVFAHVGTAIWSTSVILIGGFLVLTLSAFALNEQLGLLTAMTIGIALIMDLTLLPAMMVIFGKRRNEKESKNETSPRPGIV